MKLIKENRCFQGIQKQYSHDSNLCDGEMTFSIYLPDGVGKSPVLYWLSGLTCNDENFVQKAGAQRIASELGLAIVCPDTSPRGSDYPGEHDSWDFGSGAGFYVDATQKPWLKNYKMYSYVTKELPNLLSEIVDNSRASISGHSMGGHGALICAFKNPEKYKSVSAFSPICAPSSCGWGKKAFKNYLGEEHSSEYDASILLSEHGSSLPILIDQGSADEFLDKQLMPHKLKSIADEKELNNLELRTQQGYDHSYFFIATFIEEHLRFHHKHLKT